MERVCGLANNRDAELAGSRPIVSTTMNGEKVWLLEDGEAFTMLYPEEY